MRGQVDTAPEKREFVSKRFSIYCDINITITQSLHFMPIVLMRLVGLARLFVLILLSRLHYAWL